MRSAFDFAPFRRSTVGFDRLFDMLENSAAGQGQENYPPFDLVRVDDNHFRINIAVAGFKPDEIDITAQQNVLIVAGKKVEDEGKGFIHRGIANRSFERRFGLADHVKVKARRLEGRPAVDRPGARDPRGNEAAQDPDRRRERRRQADDRGQGRKGRSPRLIAEHKGPGSNSLPGLLLGWEMLELRVS